MSRMGYFGAYVATTVALMCVVLPMIAAGVVVGVAIRAFQVGRELAVELISWWAVEGGK